MNLLSVKAKDTNHHHAVWRSGLVTVGAHWDRGCVWCHHAFDSLKLQSRLVSWCSRHLLHNHLCLTFNLQPVCTHKSTLGLSGAAPQHQAVRSVSDVTNPAVERSRRVGAPWRRGGNQVWTRLRCQDLKKEAQSVFLMKICGRSQKVQWDPARTLKRFLSGFGFLVQISRKLLRRFLRAQFQKPPYLTEDHPDWRICEDWETHGLQGPEGRVHLPLCNPILEGSWNIWWR